MTRPIQGSDGKFRGSIGDGKAKVPTPNPAPRSDVDAEQPGNPPYGEQYARLETKVASTGKVGTDVPPLVAEIRQGRATYRFYAPDPETKALLEAGRLDIDEALSSGQAFPSITTCIGALDKPALPMWAAGVAADYGDNVLRELRDMDEEARDARLRELLAIADSRTGRSKFRKEAGMAHKRDSESAAARGTEVHALAEQMTRGEEIEVPAELSGYVAAAQKFHEAFPNAEFLYTEATVYNSAGGTMGTTDAIVRIGRKTYVLDYKTNKKGVVYSSTGMQLAAAANADQIVHADGRREDMPEIHGGIGIGLGPDGAMNVFLFDTARDGDHFKGFLAARQAWQWKYAAGKDPRPINPRSLLD